MEKFCLDEAKLYWSKGEVQGGSTRQNTDDRDDGGGGAHSLLSDDQFQQSNTRIGLPQSHKHEGNFNLSVRALDGDPMFVVVGLVTDGGHVMAAKHWGNDLHLHPQLIELKWELKLIEFLKKGSVFHLHGFGGSN